MASTKSAIFQTIATDLVEYAEAIREYFATLGYKVKIEPMELGFPKTPALTVRLNHTTIIIEVCEKIDVSLVRGWSAYCRSTGKDTRFALCIPHRSTQKNLPKVQDECRDRGVGIYVHQGTGIAEWFPPKDRSLTIELPNLSELPRSVRSTLGPAYEKFNRGQWKDAFEDACKAFEQKVRPYLIREIHQTQRLKIIENGAVKNPTEKQINKMPLGALKDTLKKAQPQNQTDAILYKTLDAINPDRIGIVHKSNTARTDRNLRANVGKHMHAIFQALKQLR